VKIPPKRAIAKASNLDTLVNCGRSPEGLAILKTYLKGKKEVKVVGKLQICTLGSVHFRCKLHPNKRRILQEDIQS
jgi:hypothetical protein